MGKKKNYDEDVDEDGILIAEDPADAPAQLATPVESRRKGIMPTLSVGDVLALLALIVLSAALLLEGYHKEFKDYSKEIIALFAVVVGFLLGRKT
ncbi:MAG TPA: hypothetical protein VH852_05255 [Hyphomicrobium sp.]|jgi:hypothetical protein